MTTTAHDATPTPGKPWWRRENSRAVFVGRPAEYRIVIKPEDECWAAREPEMEKISGTIASAPALAEENARLRACLETIEIIGNGDDMRICAHAGERGFWSIAIPPNGRGVFEYWWNKRCAALARKEPEDV